MSYEAFISDRSCVKISYGIVVSSSPSFEINGYMYKGTTRVESNRINLASG